MSRLDDLPPDQRATLSLLLRQGKTYAEVAAILEIPERAVHDRAHAALAILAAPQARELTAAQRKEVGDYLLGQRGHLAERLATRTFLEGSPEARAWAGALTEELAPLAPAALPELPNGTRPGSAAATDSQLSPAPDGDFSPPRVSDTAPLGRGRGPSSRLGGAFLLAAILAGVIVAVVLLNSGGGSHRSGVSESSGPAGTAPTETQKAQAKEDKRITLTPPNAESRAIGVAEVLSEGSQYAFYLAVQHLPPSKGKGFFYAVWLYDSPGSYKALSRVPDVGPSGSAQGGALLPSDAGHYNTMLITRETNPRPSRPGPIVLRGTFALH